MPDVSFSMPQRKKFTLEVTKSGYVRARNQSSKEVEFGLPVGEIGMSKKKKKKKKEKSKQRNSSN